MRPGVVPPDMGRSLMTPTANRRRSETWLNPKFTPQRWLRVDFEKCPLGISLGVLGRKWTPLILRDLGAYRLERFNRLLESIPGIPPKVLATRLKELEAAGLIEKIEESRSPIRTRWDLTDRGRDLLPALMLITAFESKYAAEEIHPGRPPMKVHELYDREAMSLLESFL
jgi:DNA-binding HxlR family transcriptional regulator